MLTWFFLVGNRNLLPLLLEQQKKTDYLSASCGGPVGTSFAQNDPNIGSMLLAGYPGEVGEIALAEIIFGNHYPGKLFFFSLILESIAIGHSNYLVYMIPS